MSQVLVGTTSGGFDSFFIDLLGHWAQRLAVIGTCVLFVLLGAPVGWMGERVARRTRVSRSTAGAAVFLLPWVLAVALYPAGPDHAARPVYAAVMLPVFLAAGAVAGRVTGKLSNAEARARARQTDLERRALMRAVWVGGAGLLLGASSVGRLLRPGKDPGAEALRLANVTPPSPRPRGPGDVAFARITGLTPEVTPLASHYVVDEEIINPMLDPRTWRLTVSGDVHRAVSFTYGELLRMDAVERYQTLECVSNKVGGNLMSTALWAGIPLPDILEQAGVGSGAVEVVFRASSGYSDSLSIEQAMDRSTLVAVGMDGHVLPRAHGFPARLLSIATYGMKNPKWLTGIEVVNRPFEGFWEQRGWSKPAIVKTSSRIDVPPDGARVGRRATIAGVAFAGDRGISRVEVSMDGGRTWGRAELKSALSPLTWRLWRFEWTPARPGLYRILARAFDGEGRPQIATPANPFPSGASGYDAVVLER
jgi:DMSO/TMAO reductase YedYZ molybdopterin-dependent catalytic subunit